MRSYNAPTLAAFQNRAGICARILVWVVARNRTTGAPETLGLWTGAQDREFRINSVDRVYAGAGPVMEIPPIKMQTGIAVRMQRMTFSPLAPEVADLIKTYDARFAPLEIHRALFSLDDGAQLAPPHLVWKGFIDEIEVSYSGDGKEATCEVTAASSARLLTRTLPLKRSDATQQLRSGDRFRRYVDVSGRVDVWWGESRGGGRAAPDFGFAKDVIKQTNPGHGSFKPPTAGSFPR